MAITLGDLVERLETTVEDLERQNYGNAAQRLTNTIRILQENGITIHVTATTGRKKVESNDSQEN